MCVYETKTLHKLVGKKLERSMSSLKNSRYFKFSLQTCGSLSQPQSLFLLTTSLQGKQGVQGAYALVRGGSSASNLLEPSRTTSSQSPSLRAVMVSYADSACLSPTIA